jgi:hypothetical protein
MSSTLHRSIRFYPTETEFLSQYRMNNGDVFYDKDKKTLVIYDGNSKGGIPLLRADLDNAESGLGVSVNNSPPTNARSGSLWFNTNTGVLYVYVEDNDSVQWVQPSIPQISQSSSSSGGGSGGVPVVESNSFGVITVTGQSNILAGTPTAALRLTAGTGISLTTNPTTSAVTISATNTNVFSGNYDDLTNKPTIPNDTSQLINNSGFVTQTEIDTAISNLVDTAPDTLNTLNELAAALGDDANFATTVTTALGDKAPINNPTFTGTVGGVTATHVGLGNVTNESKTTMFTSPSFTSNGTNNVMTIDSEGVNIVRGGLELDDSSGTGASRISFRNSSGQLGYIDTFGQYDIFPNNTSGFGFYTSIGNLALTISDDFGIVARRPILEPIQGNSGGGQTTVIFNTATEAVFRISNWDSDFTANFYNLPTGTGASGAGVGPFSYTAAIIIDQGSTAYIPTAVEINGDSEPILWLGGSLPTGTANGVDIASFVILRRNVTMTTYSWTVLGSLTSYS